MWNKSAAAAFAGRSCDAHPSLDGFLRKTLVFRELLDEADDEGNVSLSCLFDLKVGHKTKSGVVTANDANYAKWGASRIL